MLQQQYPEDQRDAHDAPNRQEWDQKHETGASSQLPENQGVPGQEVHASPPAPAPSDPAPPAEPREEPHQQDGPAEQADRANPDTSGYTEGDSQNSAGLQQQMRQQETERLLWLYVARST